MNCILNNIYDKCHNIKWVIQYYNIFYKKKKNKNYKNLNLNKKKKKKKKNYKN